MSGYWQPIEVGNDVHSTCLNCGPRPVTLRYADDPTPVFGVVTIRRDGETVAGTVGEAATLVRRWRAAARVDPKHAWVIEVDGSLPGVRYTRQTNGRWMATHRSLGWFA